MNKDSVCPSHSIDNRSDSQPSFAEFWQSGRIVSLWDMKPVALLQVFTTGGALGMTQGIDTLDPGMHKIVGEGLKNFMKHCGELNLPSAYYRCARIARDHFSGKPYAEIDLLDLQRDIKVLRECLEDDLRGRIAFIVEANHETYYTNNQFNEESRRAFEICVPDMVEAGRCFALDRFPACVFHLMRIYDAGVKQLCEYFNVTAPTRNVGQLLTALKDKLKDGKTGKDVEKENMASDLIERLTAIKNNPRDPLSHSDVGLADDSIHRIDQKYTEEEAKRHFDNIKALTQQIAKIVS